MADGGVRLRVAVVDDDALTRDLVVRALGQLDVEVVGTAEDGASALALMDTRPIDVLVCDLNMPGMDGIELLRHLAARQDAPALAMISGDDHILRIAGDLGKAHRLRVLGTIPKPATPTVLQAAFDRIGTSDTPPTMVAYAEANLILDASEILSMVPDKLELHYQPMIDLNTGRTVAVEALARMRHATGLLGPAVFVPLFEQRGLSLTLFYGVIDQALRQLATWRAGGLPVGISINTSADDLVDLTMVERLQSDAERLGVEPRDITLELTETRILPEAAGPIETLMRLRMRGVRLAIDDFGTGFSSLDRLRRVPFTELKIDQTFVASSTTDEQARTLVKSSLDLARDLNLSTVAEGIETATQLDLMTELGCAVAQGFHIAHPMPAEAATAWLETNLR